MDEITRQTPARLGWRDIGASLRYPARRQPLLFVALSALCLTVNPLGGGLLGLWPPLQAGLRIPLALATGVLGLAALVLFPAYCGAIVRCAAGGDDGVAETPRLSQLQALIVPALKIMAVALGSFLPLLIYLLSVDNAKMAPSPAPVIALLVLGSLYLPMALLRLILSGKLWPCFLPSNVIDPVVRTFPSYWRVWLLMLAVALFLPGSALVSWIPVAGPTLAVFSGLYLLCCAMHALGRFGRLEEQHLQRA